MQKKWKEIKLVKPKTVRIFPKVNKTEILKLNYHKIFSVDIYECCKIHWGHKFLMQISIPVLKNGKTGWNVNTSGNFCICVLYIFDLQYRLIAYAYQQFNSFFSSCEILASDVKYDSVKNRSFVAWSLYL